VVADESCAASDQHQLVCHQTIIAKLMPPSGYFAHPTAIVESLTIGEGTHIWAFAHVQEAASLGKNCNIGDHCFIEAGVVLGDDVVVKNGVSIWEGVTIDSKVFVGPDVTFTNDSYPRAKVRRPFVNTHVHEGASLGAHSTILAGVKIGAFSMVGAGALVSHDVADHALVMGIPARQVGYVCRCGLRLPDLADVGERVCSCGMRFDLQDGTMARLP